MRRTTACSRAVLFALLVLTAGLPPRAQAETAPEKPKGGDLAVHPGTRGTLTHWLLAPAVPGAVGTLEKPPANVREGEAGPGGGVWSYAIAEGDFTEPKDQIRGVRGGSVWAFARVRSETGGARVLTGFAFGALRVFVDGKLVLDKPAPNGDRSDSKRATIKLPKGECEVAVASGIRWSYCNFALFLTSEKMKPVPGDGQTLPLAGAPDPYAALARSMSFTCEFPFVNEGRMAAVQLALQGGWPAGIEMIRPRFIAPDGKEIPAEPAAQSPEEAAAKPWRITFKVPEKLAADTSVSCEFIAGKEPDAKVLARRALRLYSVNGIRAESARIEKLVAEAEAKTGRPFPNARLSLEKLGIWLDRLAAGAEHANGAVGTTLLELIESAKADLVAEAAGFDPFQGRTGYLERAYWSKIDESPQPYFALVPSAAKDELAKPRAQAQKFPLVVFLHGYVPDYHKHRWWTEMPEFNAVFERQGAFLCIPFGRSNADFVGCGEEDILDVVTEMKKTYPIDEDRVYLYGYSMGGMGVYTLGAHHPDPWAAGIVIAGRADSPLLMKTQGMASLHPFKQWIIKADHPIDLCENFVNIPMRIYHGDQDQFIPPADAQRMEKRLKEIGCDAKLEIHPGNHWFGFDLMADDAPVKWLLEHTRAKDPKVWKLKNYILRYGRLADAELCHVTGKLNAFDLEWSRGDAGVKLAKMKGPVSLLRVKDGEGAIPEADGEFTAIAGKEMDGRKWTYFARKGPNGPGEALGDAAWKTTKRCGPVKEATYSPFLIVYGTAGDADAQKRVKAQAEQFADMWYDFAKGKAQIKADKDVTEEDKKTRNLFLFGEEQENAVHAAYAATKKLPFVVKDGKAQIGEKSVDLKDRGLMYIYPSPYEGAAPYCSVVVCAGLVYGQHLPFNHKLDLVPDFLVYSAEIDNDATSTNKPVVAGFFDGKWKMSEDLTWFFE
ncbi:MAG: prolyl oligopeptidase family serine peptidase [Planctomycetota bacterium]|nr:prolyl oligopeptidase family serine peptidase [Planctomycetota bacterium]